jgi:hypothetical protein
LPFWYLVYSIWISERDFYSFCRQDFSKPILGERSLRVNMEDIYGLELTFRRGTEKRILNWFPTYLQQSHLLSIFLCHDIIRVIFGFTSHELQQWELTHTSSSVDMCVNLVNMKCVIDKHLRRCCALANCQHAPVID